MEIPDGQGMWLSAFQNRFDNIRCKISESEDPAYIDFIKPGLLGEGPLIERFSMDDSVIPVVSAGYGRKFKFNVTARAVPFA